MSRKLKITLIVTGAVLIVGFLIYQWRERIVGQFVPEVTRIYSVNLNWKNDSLVGNAALEIKNKSGTPIHIDSLEMEFSLGGVRFLNLKQEVNIDLAPKEYDSLLLDINIPIERFFSFLDSVAEIDSTEMMFSLNIYYNVNGGQLKLPINKAKMVLAPRQVMVQLVDVELKEYNDKQLKAEMFIHVYNPGKLDFSIVDVDYKFNTSGDISTAGSYDKEILIKPGESKTIVLPVSIDIEKPLQTISNVITDNDSYSYTLIITGKVHTESPMVNNMQVILHKEGFFEIRKEDTVKKEDERSKKEIRKEKREEKKEENKK